MKNINQRQQVILIQGLKTNKSVQKEGSYRHHKLKSESGFDKKIVNVKDTDLIEIKQQSFKVQIKHCQKTKREELSQKKKGFNQPIRNRLTKNILISNNMQTSPHEQQGQHFNTVQQPELFEQIKQRKGRFTQQQQKLITNAVGQFLATNQISFEDFLLLLHQKNVINTVLRRANFFNIISKQLPGRSPFSCYRFIKRVFNPKNKKRPWSMQEQSELIQLVKDNGHQWTIIGKILERSPDSVYDKYRSLGCQNAEKRTKSEWQLRQYVKLLLEVNSRANLKFIDQNVASEIQHENIYNIQERISNRQKRYNTHNEPKPFLKIAARYLNQNIRKINIEGIGWSAIASKLKKKSMIDCKNKFMQLFQFAGRSFPFDDLKIVEFIISRKFEQEQGIIWDTWQADEITASQAKNRFLILKRTVKNKSIKTFMQIVLEIKQKLLKKKNSI